MRCIVLSDDNTIINIIDGDIEHLLKCGLKAEVNATALVGQYKINGVFHDSMQQPPTTVPLRTIPRSFIDVLGNERGMAVWAEIKKSSHPACIYWMSEYDTGEPVDPFYPPLLAAIRLLLTIPNSTGGTILQGDEAERIITALQTIQ